MGPGRKPRKEPTRARTNGGGREASMGPGRKPRKEPPALAPRSAPSPCFNGAWAKTQEGTGTAPCTATFPIGASMGPGRKPRKEHEGAAGRHRGAAAASMGPGRKPRKERRPRSPSPATRSRINGAWAKTQEGTFVRMGCVRPTGTLQWGLGENPGRNTWNVGIGNSLGWLQWGLGENPGRNQLLGLLCGGLGGASMGPGRKPRKERPTSSRCTASVRTCFNGAWAKTQEGTPSTGLPPGAVAAGFNGAWAKT